MSHRPLFFTDMSMRFAWIFAAIGLLVVKSGAGQIWPHHLSVEERDYVERQGFTPRPVARGIETPPPFNNLRTSAEWEEIEALTITWTGYPCILKQIVAGAIDECQVIIFAETTAEVTNALTGSSCGGPLPLDSVLIVETDYNSIWIRDYGAHTVYGNYNDDRVLVDWLYNRPRPDDDVIPDVLAETLDIPLYSTTAAPTDLMNTGGNWMTDGFGTAFASELIFDENMGGSTWWTDYPDHTEAEIDDIVAAFHGIDTYIKMPTLPYDGIHHIDMHMKLLDEERILLAEYPSGVADGPQIEANIEYVLSNFTTRWGTPFEVIRIPSPPELGWGGGYPDDGGWYQTYTNSVFVNNTILLPTYYEEYDTTAIRIYEEALPGFNVVGIDCDGNEPIIAASGAIHCITNSVGVADPLIISHLPLDDTDDTENDYIVNAEISHRSGIASAECVYTTDGLNWASVSMVDLGDGTFEAALPAAPAGTEYHYYIDALSESGKNAFRPSPGPDGSWDFLVFDGSSSVAFSGFEAFSRSAFPNPASAITCIPVNLSSPIDGRLEIVDVLGRTLGWVFEGTFPRGESKFFIDAATLPAGPCLIRLTTSDGVPMSTQRLIVR